MRCYRVPLLATLVALAAAFGTASATAAPQSFNTGVTWAESAAAVDPAEDMKRVRALGLRYLRIEFDWASNRISSGTWRETDGIVSAAVARGLLPILTVVNPPRSAFRTGCGGGGADCQLRLSALKQFGKRLARRYSGRFSPPDTSSNLPKVRYWQLWDEINRRAEGLQVARRSIPASHYRSEINAFTDGVRAVSPASVILTGGVVSSAVPGREVMPLRYLRQVLCIDHRNRPRPRCRGIKADVLGISPYTPGSPGLKVAHRDDFNIGSARRAVRLAHAARKAGRLRHRVASPVWVTAFAWKSVYQKAPRPEIELDALDWSEQAVWMDDAFERLHRSGVSTVIWDKLRDTTLLNKDLYGRCCPSPEPPSLEWLTTPESGLYTDSSDPAYIGYKPPVAEAIEFPLRLRQSMKKSLEFWGRVPRHSSGAVKATLSIQRGRSYVERALRIRPGTGGIIRGTLTARSGKVVKRYEVPPNSGITPAERTVSLRVSGGPSSRSVIATPAIRPQRLRSSLGYEVN